MIKNRKAWIVYALCLLVIILVHFVDYPGSVPNFKIVAQGAPLLDLKPSFSEQAIYDRLEAYGPQGRQLYSFRLWTSDLILPVSATLLIFTLFLKVSKKLLLSRAVKIFLFSIPLLYFLFDLVENFSILAMLRQFPARMHFLSAILPYATLIKRAAAILGLFLPLFLNMYLFYKRSMKQ